MQCFLKQDEKIVFTGQSENECLAWIHNNTSFSWSHAMTYEGYAIFYPCHVCGTLISKEELDENAAYSYPEGLPHCPDHYDEEPKN